MRRSPSHRKTISVNHGAWNVAFSAFHSVLQTQGKRVALSASGPRCGTGCYRGLEGTAVVQGATKMQPQRDLVQRREGLRLHTSLQLHWMAILDLCGISVYCTGTCIITSSMQSDRRFFCSTRRGFLLPQHWYRDSVQQWDCESSFDILLWFQLAALINHIVRSVLPDARSSGAPAVL